MKVKELISGLSEHKPAYLYVNGKIKESYDGRNSLTGRYDDYEVSSYDSNAMATNIYLWI